MFQDTSMDSNTPAETTPVDMETPKNDHIIRRRREWEMSDSFRDEIKQMIEGFKEDMETKINEIRQDIKESSNMMLTELLERLTMAEKQNTLYADTIKKLDERILNLECDQTKTIQRLEDKMEEFLRYKRRKAVEIKNIPFAEGEVIKDSLGKLFEVVGLQDLQLKSAFRAFSRKNDSSTIVVKFACVDDKKKLLKHVKGYNLANAGNKLNAENLGFKGNKNFIYVNDYLTPHAKNIYFHSRVFAKSNNYRFCWTKDGKVFLKKDENHKALLINNKKMLDSLEDSK